MPGPISGRRLAFYFIALRTDKGPGVLFLIVAIISPNDKPKNDSRPLIFVHPLHSRPFPSGSATEGRYTVRGFPAQGGMSKLVWRPVLHSSLGLTQSPDRTKTVRVHHNRRRLEEAVRRSAIRRRATITSTPVDTMRRFFSYYASILIIIND